MDTIFVLGLLVLFICVCFCFHRVQNGKQDKSLFVYIFLTLICLFVLQYDIFSWSFLFLIICTIFFWAYMSRKTLTSSFSKHIATKHIAPKHNHSGARRTINLESVVEYDNE